MHPKQRHYTFTREYENVSYADNSSLATFYASKFLIKFKEDRTFFAEIDMKAEQSKCKLYEKCIKDIMTFVP
jgi:hypothetical protein